MAVTLSTPGTHVAGNTCVFKDFVTPIDTTAAQTVTLPDCTDLPIGYQFWLSQNGANAVTIAAPTGNTLVGDTATVADNDVIRVFKSGATEWTGNLTPAT